MPNDVNVGSIAENDKVFALGRPNKSRTNVCVVSTTGMMAFVANTPDLLLLP